MKVERIDQAIEVCKRHILDSSAMGTEIEVFLTRYLLVLICATFEEEIEKIISRRASISDDEELEAFVISCLNSVFRSTKTSEVVGLLGRFGSDCKEIFRQKVIENQKAETFYNNIVINRHSTAHESGAQTTFNELVNFYEEGHVILDFIQEAVFSKSTSP